MVEAEIFLFSIVSRPASYSRGAEVLSLWIKWPGSEADYSPPSRAKVKNV
jgi:hypothetical protein